MCLFIASFSTSNVLEYFFSVNLLEGYLEIEKCWKCKYSLQSVCKTLLLMLILQSLYLWWNWILGWPKIFQGREKSVDFQQAHHIWS